jgi:hypothetical protein
MARPKKTTKKATAKKATAKKTSTRGRKPAGKAQAGASTASIKLLKGTTTNASLGTRRPPNNPDMPQEIIDSLNHDLNAIKNALDDYSQHLRSLDRMRLNGVGIKKMGFIERAYELALENGEFLPHYLTVERFGTDIQYFMDFRSLTDLVTQIREKLWNITIQSADIAYTDALEFYASVREAAKRRVDAAETLHNALSIFFKHHRGETEEPTEKQALRDFKGLNSGKHDGKLIIENEKPKLIGGKRKIIDERFSDTAQFRESEDGEIKE